MRMISALVKGSVVSMGADMYAWILYPTTLKVCLLPVVNVLDSSNDNTTNVHGKISIADHQLIRFASLIESWSFSLFSLTSGLGIYFL